MSNIKPYDTIAQLLSKKTWVVPNADCFQWCLFIGHIQYVSFGKILTSIILSNRAPILENSITIILMKKKQSRAILLFMKYIVLHF